MSRPKISNERVVLTSGVPTQSFEQFEDLRQITDARSVDIDEMTARYVGDYKGRKVYFYIDRNGFQTAWLARPDKEIVKELRGMLGFAGPYRGNEERAVSYHRPGFEGLGYPTE